MTMSPLLISLNTTKSSFAILFFKYPSPFCRYLYGYLITITLIVEEDSFHVEQNLTSGWDPGHLGC